MRTNESLKTNFETMMKTIQSLRTNFETMNWKTASWKKRMIGNSKTNFQTMTMTMTENWTMTMIENLRNWKSENCYSKNPNSNLKIESWTNSMIEKNCYLKIEKMNLMSVNWMTNPNSNSKTGNLNLMIGNLTMNQKNLNLTWTKMTTRKNSKSLIPLPEG